MTKIRLSLLLFILASTQVMAASGDEIQVYDDEINQPGELGVEIHTNYVRSGDTSPAYPGEIPSHHNFRATPEFNYGLTRNVDGGVYIPTIRDADGSWFVEGAKLRLKYMADKQEGGFYWGVNGELGHIAKRTEPERWNLEIRPIIGYRTGNWHLAANPIVGASLSGASSHVPSLTPAYKINYRTGAETWVGIEHYIDGGPTNNLANQGQELYLAAETEIGGIGLNVGVGHGWAGANNSTLKAIFNVPLKK